MVSSGTSEGYHLLCTKIGPNHDETDPQGKGGKGQSVGKVLERSLAAGLEEKKRKMMTCITYWEELAFDKGCALLHIGLISSELHSRLLAN